MMRRATYVPDGVPVLSRGRHRNPRRGACFMEMASFLAGERWSDHPSCTHPVLATLARCVNDLLDETHRQQLVPMIPEVVGLNPADERVATALVLTVARAAVPISSEERQNVMALAILNAEGLIAEQEGRDAGALSPASRAALAHAPAAERWARVHLARMGFSASALRPSHASKIVALGVDGIARACVDDSQARLSQLLRDAIDVVATFVPLAPETPEATATMPEAAPSGHVTPSPVSEKARPVAG